MCGIAGIIEVRRQGFSGEERRIEAEICTMNSLQKHRGPDGEGVFVEAVANYVFGFGHRRLSILDLSSAGNQPMVVRSRQGSRLVLTYNGEIYNYIELRADLKARGYRFTSSTDSEVLLRAYEEWGESCLEKLNGMFAFVIFDESKQVIFAARDRFGVKPFYYREKPGRFEFASEIKAILGIGRSGGIDDQTVVDYLLTGHIGFSERTFFKDVKELRPGHWLTLDLNQGKWTIAKWYDLRERVESFERTSSGQSQTSEEAAFEVRRVLTEAVQLRLRSDVPIGTCLSGGIDSSSIASIASGILTKSAADQGSGSRAFIGITASSLDSQNDETPFAKQVAVSSGLDWHCVCPQGFLENLEEVVRFQDEPFGGLSIFMQEAVMAKAKALGVPVLLDGQGGDEVFLGYPKYLQGFGGFRPRLLAKRFASQIGILEKRELELELSQTLPDEVKKSKAHLLKYRRTLSDPQKAQIMDITETNLPQLLRYEDRNSMHHSIETRLPFLDYRLVELGVALPKELKIDTNGVQKSILRRAMRGVVPDGILDRQDKVGFAPPDRVWSGSFERLWRERVLSSPYLRTLLGPRALFTKDLRRGLSAGAQWKIINLALWV